MSFASILSGPTEEEERPPKKPSPSPTPLAQLPSAAPLPPAPAPVPAEQKFKEPESTPAPPKLQEKKQTPKDRRRNVELEPPVGDFPVPSVANGAAVSDSKKPPSTSTPRKTLTERDMEIINKITADIEKEDKSDVEGPGFEDEYERYVSKGKKRALNTEWSEGIRRKVCCFFPHWKSTSVTNLNPASPTWFPDQAWPVV